ncbi:LysR family transcriptional regulator (plasmid) [Verrucomicrobiaceae bacterium 227]
MDKINRLELRQLRTFQALLREGNVSRVASQIGLTQQAVSDQLKKLREIFDDPLFVRKTNGLVPTPLARNLEDRVNIILRETEGLLAPDVFDLKKARATYVIVATDYAQLIVLPWLLSMLRKEAPGVKVVVRDFDEDHLHDLMLTGRVDLAICLPDSTPPTYRKTSLFTEHHVCVTSKKSRLPKRKLSLAELAAIPQIVAASSSANYRGSIETLFRDAGLSPNVAISAPCFTVIPSFLEQTDTIAFLPSRIVSNYSLKIIKHDDCQMDFIVAASWHARSDNDPLHQWIVDLLTKKFE